MKPLLLIFLLFNLLACACAKSENINLSIAYNNLSDSYIYPYRIMLNGKVGIPKNLIGCSEGVNTASIAVIHLSSEPRSILVEWEHLLSRKTYRAHIPLQAKAEKWWRNSPFRDASDQRLSRPPVLVVQWRGAQQVVAMLVASSNDFSKGKIDIGSAEGEEIPPPAYGPKLYLGYSDLAPQPGDDYRPGDIDRYERRLDDTLSPFQRFGCPRTPDGRLDRKRLPPQKLPYMIGANGEHIPCRAEFCADREDEIRALRSLGWRRYPANQTPPAIEFRDAPNPTPAR